MAITSALRRSSIPCSHSFLRPSEKLPTGPTKGRHHAGQALLDPMSEALRSTGVPTYQAFLWGALGGLASALLVYVVPALVRAHLWPDSVQEPQNRRRATWNVAKLLAILSFVAGVISIGGQPQSTAHAVLDGMGIQAIMKAILASAHEAVVRPQPARRPPRTRPK